MWPTIKADVRSVTRGCLQCQRSKVSKHTVTHLMPFRTTGTRFDHVHLDIVRPLPPCWGFTYILTCVDRYTRWPEASPLPDVTAETVAETFIEIWVARFGCPSTVTTDRRRQFQCSLFAALKKIVGTHQMHTTSYHSSANGMVERLHRQLKASIMARHGRLQ